MELFRPTGLEELRLVLASGMTAWPPRLRDQPIFYPVLNLDYAIQIARDWNATSPEQVGYATRFVIDDAYAARFDRHVVGAREHAELWVPAEELAELNTFISGPITVERSFFGPGFRGLIPQTGDWAGLDARAQLRTLSAAVASNEDLLAFVRREKEAVFLHLPFWELAVVSPNELEASRESVLAATRHAWAQLFPSVPLPVIFSAPRDA